MATAPTFAATPRCNSVVISTANAQSASTGAGRDGTGTLGTVFTAGASGSRIDEVRIVARVTTTAGAVRLFVHDGTNAYLIKEQSIGGTTAAASTPAEAYAITFDNLFLPAGYSLRASTEVAQAFVVTAFGGDF